MATRTSSGSDCPRLSRSLFLAKLFDQRSELLLKVRRDVTGFVCEVEESAARQKNLPCLQGIELCYGVHVCAVELRVWRRIERAGVTTI